MIEDDLIDNIQMFMNTRLITYLILVCYGLSCSAMVVRFGPRNDGQSDNYYNYNIFASGELYFPDPGLNGEYWGPVVLQHFSLTTQSGNIPLVTGPFTHDVTPVPLGIVDSYVGPSSADAFHSYIWSGNGQRYSRFTRKDTGLTFTDSRGGVWQIDGDYPYTGRIEIRVPDIYGWNGQLLVNLESAVTLPGGFDAGTVSTPDSGSTLGLASAALGCLFFLRRGRSSQGMSHS